MRKPSINLYLFKPSINLYLFRECLILDTSACSRLRRSLEVVCVVEKCAARIFPQHTLPPLRGKAARPTNERARMLRIKHPPKNRALFVCNDSAAGKHRQV
jgi:hypothetical protein